MLIRLLSLGFLVLSLWRIPKAVSKVLIVLWGAVNEKGRQAKKTQRPPKLVKGWEGGVRSNLQPG